MLRPAKHTQVNTEINIQGGYRESFSDRRPLSPSPPPVALNPRRKNKAIKKSLTLINTKPTWPIHLATRGQTRGD